MVHTCFDTVVSLESLFSSWEEFRKGKMGRRDVQMFFLELESNLIDLHRKLQDARYKHSEYSSFFVCDPKLRHISKAEVGDRILHHAIVRHIEPSFERGFIFDSYSSRRAKGTHRAVKRLQKFSLSITRNATRTAWALKCDVRKFFDSIDHDILIALVEKKVNDTRLMRVIEEIIRSHRTDPGKGLPLGNLTSQLFSNVYLNGFDHFVKRVLRVKYYIRYADDFVILHENREYLEELLKDLERYLEACITLHLHPGKISIRKIHTGIDFLGYVVFPTHRVLRTKTKRRMLRKMKAKKKDMQSRLMEKETFNQSAQSYLGLLRHCRGGNIQRAIEGILKR